MLLWKVLFYSANIVRQLRGGLIIENLTRLSREEDNERKGRKDWIPGSLSSRINDEIIFWVKVFSQGLGLLVCVCVFSIFSSDFQIVLKGCVNVCVSVCVFQHVSHSLPSVQMPWALTLHVLVHTHILPQSLKTVIIQSYYESEVLEYTLHDRHNIKRCACSLFLSSKPNTL